MARKVNLLRLWRGKQFACLSVNHRIIQLMKNKTWLKLQYSTVYFSIKFKIEQKGIVFLPRFWLFFLPFLFPPKREGRRKGKWISKVVVKNNAFLLDLKSNSVHLINIQRFLFIWNIATSYDKQAMA